MKTFRELLVGEFFEFEFGIWQKTSDTDIWNARRCESEYELPGQFDDEEWVIAVLG